MWFGVLFGNFRHKAMQLSTLNLLFIWRETHNKYGKWSKIENGEEVEWNICFDPN